MIALLTACLIFEILLHQQKRARKLCSATLNISKDLWVSQKIISYISYTGDRGMSCQYFNFKIYDVFICLLSPYLLLTFVDSTSTIISHTALENQTPAFNVSDIQATVSAGNYSVPISSTQWLPSHCHRVCVCNSSEGE